MMVLVLKTRDLGPP